MKISYATCLFVVAAGLCHRADAQAFLFNHIGDVNGDPNSLEFVPQGGTGFGSYYTAENYFFGVVPLTNPGGNNVLRDWWEVRSVSPSTLAPWDGFQWSLTVHSTRSALIGQPLVGDLLNLTLSNPDGNALNKVDHNGDLLYLLHWHLPNVPLANGWYSVRSDDPDNHATRLIEGSFSGGISSDTWVRSTGTEFFVRQHPLHQYSGYLNVAASYAPVPEPATLAGLGLGALALFRRRRRLTGSEGRRGPVPMGDTLS
ncbi:MAG: PEP-CTERM sorting domain-containing protein [Fimbriimonadaceae bacterium]|nr:PEP-CTERM sorting domain-containing protein [Fimbriimonadaceae bacterium]